MRALLCLALLAPVLAAQTTFEDTEFSFTLEVPAGLVLLDEATFKQVTGIPAEAEINGPIDPVASSPQKHLWFWRDESGRGRQMRLVLEMHPQGLPFTKPDDFIRFVKEETGLEIESQEQVPGTRPQFVVEGTRNRADGAIIRSRVVYLILGQKTYGSLFLEGLDVDWSELSGQYDAVLSSADYPAPNMDTGGAPGAGPMGPAGPGAPAASNGPGAARGGSTESWSSLHVTGSLVLAVALLMSLVFGGGKGS